MQRDAIRQWNLAAAIGIGRDADYDLVLFWGEVFRLQHPQS